MQSPIVIRKLKFDGSVRYEWEGELIEELDGWAIVLHDTSRHQKHDSKPSPNLEPGVGLHYLGLDSPLTVLFWFDPSLTFCDAKCDASLPASHSGNGFDFVDLDLDVIVLPGLQHYVRDQEGFAERSTSMGYSESARRAAHAGILRALRAVRRRQFPFDGSPERLIREVAGGKPGRK